MVVLTLARSHLGSLVCCWWQQETWSSGKEEEEEGGLLCGLCGLEKETGEEARGEASEQEESLMAETSAWLVRCHDRKIGGPAAGIHKGSRPGGAHPAAGVLMERRGWLEGAHPATTPATTVLTSRLGRPKGAAEVPRGCSPSDRGEHPATTALTQRAR
jgi:hypothetical protein